MIHPTRATSGLTPALAAAVFCAMAGSAVPRATGQGDENAVNADQPELYRKVKVFDFDERPLGNFEDTPMHWRRLTGEGLPAYSQGRLDDSYGHIAPPSFVFSVQGGSVAFEYVHSDLAISPKSDYLIEAYVQAEGLEYAAALLLCYLVDQAGERIAGSERLSQPIKSVAGSGSEEPWQRIEVALPGEFPTAHTLRLQLWVLQTHVYQPPDEAAADPIVRQEVDARVWFDDITIIRMPRLRLGFSNPGGIVRPGVDESLRVEVHNATLAPLRAVLNIRDDAGAVQHRELFELPAHATEEYRVAIPSLAPGPYAADVELSSDERVLLRRSIRFAVLPALFSAPARYADLGVDLGLWAEGDAEGAVELIRALGCGAVKIGLTMADVTQDSQREDCFRQARAVARQLAVGEVSATGVLLAPPSPSRPTSRSSTFEILLGEGGWAERLGPLFAHFGGHLTSWQLGQEAIELARPGGWTPTAVARVRDRLKRFVAVPQLVIPRSVLDMAPVPGLLNAGGGDVFGPLESPAADPGASDEGTQPYAYSYWIPADLPARAIPWHLAFWMADVAAGGPAGRQNSAGASAARWLSLGLDRRPRMDDESRLADLARRLVLARAVNPDRVYVPAPFELSTAGGSLRWQPTEEYIPVRTLMHALSGTRAVAAVTLDEDSVGVLFQGDNRHRLVAWTWDQQANKARDLYLGTAAVGLELNGQPHPLERVGPRVRVPLAPVPLIIENVDAALLLLQESFEVSPAFIQLHAPEPRPVLRLRNTYPVELAGVIELRPPADWAVSPTPLRVLLQPGETLAQVLDFVIPPRTIAAPRALGVDLHLRRPDPVDLHFDVRLEVGLKDVAMDTTLWWERGDLLVEQSIRNLSPRPLSFNTFCQPPQHAQLEGVLLNIPPGDARTRTYRIPAARELAGGELWIGLQEIGGPRTLDQLVAVPP
mgnify:FL=1